jgi:class 3 adenylate cyclase
VVAGIIGSLRMSYDVWGDTVNFASRLESTAPPDGIHVSQAVVERGGEHFALESRGTLELKGKGSVPTWLVTGAREPGGTHRAAASQKKAANRRIRR